MTSEADSETKALKNSHYYADMYHTIPFIKTKRRKTSPYESICLSQVWKDIHQGVNCGYLWVVGLWMFKNIIFAYLIFLLSSTTVIFTLRKKKSIFIFKCATFKIRLGNF